MKPPRRRLLITLGGSILVLIPLILLLGRSSQGADRALSATVKRGDFRVIVTTTGELFAHNAVQVRGPMNASRAGQHQLRISWLIAEGTVVKEGDVVAELDRAEITARLQDLELALDKAEAQFQQAQLDSTLSLSQAREEIRNLEFQLEERQIAKEQAAFEAPSIRRQAEIDLERAQRTLAQAREHYITKKQQAEAKLREVNYEVERQRNLLALTRQVEEAYTIRAPTDGMVVYDREWGGQRKTVGSTVSSRDPTVATLPDLTQMESVTYVNEIDIRKVNVGQPVEITLDADPSKRLTGRVSRVANMAEQRPNSDAKVFEVRIDVEVNDSTILPGMTTANSILTYAMPDALSIPLETVMISEGVTFVYLASSRGIVRREIVTGLMNEDEIVVLHGLEEGDEVLFAPPADGSEPPLERLPPELVPVRDTTGAALDSLLPTMPTERQGMPLEMQGTPPEGRPDRGPGRSGAQPGGRSGQQGPPSGGRQGAPPGRQQGPPPQRPGSSPELPATPSELHAPILLGESLL